MVEVEMKKVLRANHDKTTEDTSSVSYDAADMTVTVSVSLSRNRNRTFSLIPY